MAFDIGSAAIDRPALYWGNYTIIVVDNPADFTGKISSVDLWFAAGWSGTGVKVGTFYGSGTDYTCRDYASIGNVTAGSKQTFSGLNIEVEDGDFIGVFWASGGAIEITGDSSPGIYRKVGDQLDAGLQTYAFYSCDTISCFGEGEEVVAAGRSFGFIIG